MFSLWGFAAMSEEQLQRPLANKGFLSLVATQFFGAYNDNLLKQVLSFGLAAAGIWNGVLGEGGQSLSLIHI